ncbi:MAG: mechanosensitive ion channel family protein [Planctomycetota bacterium]
MRHGRWIRIGLGVLGVGLILLSAYAGEGASAPPLSQASSTVEAANPPPVSLTSERMKELLPGSLHVFLEYRMFGFPLWRITLAGLIIFLAFIANTVIRFLLKRRQEAEDARHVPGAKSFVGMVIACGQLSLRIVVWALALRFIRPVMLEGFEKEVDQIAGILFSLAIAIFIYKLVDIVEYYLARYTARTETKLDDMLVPAVRKTLKALVLVIAGLHVYHSVSGEPITAFLAGLGIGGLAIALASQDTLKNLFGFLMILVDRPFFTGDRIDFAGHDGVVESVGFRSVKIRRLDGNQVTIPNSKVADEVVHNIGRRPYIRRLMNLTIPYDTPPEKVERAVALLQELLANHEGMREEFPPRVYFNEFNADSLNLIAIYWYHPPDYWSYMAHAQRLNLAIMRRFEEEGIEFAFPTQTLYLAGDPRRRLVMGGLSPKSPFPREEG